MDDSKGTTPFSIYNFHNEHEQTQKVYCTLDPRDVAIGSIMPISWPSYQT